MLCSTKWIFETSLGERTEVFSKFIIGKKILMHKVGWFDQEITNFINFYFVNWTSFAYVFFWGMELLLSINTQWKIPLGRPPRTFQIPGTPYPTKSYLNLKIWNLKFLIQNNSFVIHLKYSLSLTIFSHCQHCLRGQVDTACRF